MSYRVRNTPSTLLVQSLMDGTPQIPPQNLCTFFMDCNHNSNSNYNCEREKQSQCQRTRTNTRYECYADDRCASSSVRNQIVTVASACARSPTNTPGFCCNKKAGKTIKLHWHDCRPPCQQPKTEPCVSEVPALQLKDRHCCGQDIPNTECTHNQAPDSNADYEPECSALPPKCICQQVQCFCEMLAWELHNLTPELFFETKWHIMDLLRKAQKQSKCMK